MQPVKISDPAEMRGEGVAGRGPARTPEKVIAGTPLPAGSVRTTITGKSGS